MTTTTPPAFATWLLNRFDSTANGEAIAGDLVEQFQEGRSRVWYWRQVIGAVFRSVGHDIRHHYVLAIRALFIGWALYFVFGIPISRLSRILSLDIDDWVIQSRHYTQWSVFWTWQLPPTVLVPLACAVTGWIVARLHRSHAATMVSVFAGSLLAFESSLEAWMLLVRGIPLHPGGLTYPGYSLGTSSLWWILPAVLAWGRPLGVLLGGLSVTPARDSIIPHPTAE
jgi:hypothetical protein